MGSQMRVLAGVILALTVALWGIGTSADIRKSSKFNSRLLKMHTKLIDKRLSKQYNNSSRLLPGTSNDLIPRFNGSYEGVYRPMAESAARKYGVPVDLFNRLIQQESAWNPKAKSHAGAIGLAQLMPGTARALGVNPHNPQENLEGGARYLKKMYTKFRSWRLALAAYNAGPNAVDKYNGIPPYKETQNYVKKILGK